MSKILAIIRHEIGAILGRRSYIFTILFVPIIGFLIYSGASLVNQGIAPDGVTSFFENKPTSLNQGIVDESGIIKIIPEDLIDQITIYPDINSARLAIKSNEISDYFVIHDDYIISGEIDFIQHHYNFLATTSDTKSLQEVIIFNLINDPTLSRYYLQPIQFEISYLREQVEKDFGSENNFWLPYTVMVLFYVLIIGSSSLMLTSITREKSNRVMEILLTSVSPHEMLIGKIIALGITGLFQTIIWLTSSYFLLNLAGREFSLPGSITVSADIFIWGLIFFILGYALYASLMAGLGALVPDPKEGSQATLVVIFPLIIPMFFSNLVASAPNAPLFIFFSIFPLTAPISMISRISATFVPIWQILLAVFLEIAAIIFVIHNVSRAFRAQTLLSGKTFKLKSFLKVFVKS